MMHYGNSHPSMGPPGYGGVCEGTVGEQGLPDQNPRAPCDDDDLDDEHDDAPKFELPKIGVPVDATE
jgi:hypothetical protein